MSWPLSTYTIRLNHRRQLSGHVFGGHYKALLMHGSGEGYLKRVCDYVHLNPVHARLLMPEDRLLAYPWSSLGWYAVAREHRTGWMRVDRLLGEHGTQQDTAAARREGDDSIAERNRPPGRLGNLKGRQRDVASMDAAERTDGNTGPAEKLQCSLKPLTRTKPIY